MKNRDLVDIEERYIKNIMVRKTINGVDVEPDEHIHRIITIKQFEEEFGDYSKYKKRLVMEKLKQTLLYLGLMVVVILVSSWAISFLVNLQTNT